MQHDRQGGLGLTVARESARPHPARSSLGRPRRRRRRRPAQAAGRTRRARHVHRRLDRRSRSPTTRRRSGSSRTGVDLDLQLAVCRRLVGDSCPYQGAGRSRSSTSSPRSSSGSTVVVEVGYNDFEDTVRRLGRERRCRRSARPGAQHVLWLTLRAERTSYLNMNDVIRAAATRHPEMTVVDWNLYSRSHPGLVPARRAPPQQPSGR